MTASADRPAGNAPAPAPSSTPPGTRQPEPDPGHKGSDPPAEGIAPTGGADDKRPTPSEFDQSLDA